MKMESLIPGYLEELKLLNRSSRTVRNNRYGLKLLIRFLESEKVVNLEDLNRDVLSLYSEDLAYRLTDKGKQLSVASRKKYLGLACSFVRYLYEKDYLAADLGKAIRLPKLPKTLPRVILDEAEVKKMMNAPDMRTNRGCRNRVILEVLYDTGIRSAEMAGVKTADLDLDSGFLTVRSGKGAKDRVVPLGARVCELIKSYLLMIRPVLVRGKDEGYLILNPSGNRMHTKSVWEIVKRSTELAGIKKNVSPHTFRHSCATHMLKAGAPIRHIQELLGHESLESTQIYTRVTINDLKAVHAAYHPGERL